MTASAADIAAVFRVDLPGLTHHRLHKLFYLAQGHHLAWFDEPLFADEVAAWDNGPIVPALWRRDLPEPGFRGLPNKILNTVGYTASRYGKLHRVDLETLTRAQQPWVEANRGRQPGVTTPIGLDVLRAYFLTVDVDDERRPIPAARIAVHVAAAEQRRHEPATPDDLDVLRNWGREAKAAAAGG